MSEIANPHDRFFKEILSRPENARDFVTGYLPADVVDIIDESSLEMEKDSFVDEGLREHFSDVLYKASLRDGSGVFVYLLFEHKSYPEPLVALQLLRYMLKIWEHSVKQGTGVWPIVPVVLYHGEARWKVATNLHGLIRPQEELKRFVPEYQYCLCDLSGIDDGLLKRQATLALALLVLKYMHRDDLRDKLPDIMSLARQLSKERTGLEKLATILRYLSQATDKITREDLRSVVEAASWPEGAEMSKTIAEEWIEEGRAEGLQQGMQQGMQQGLQQGVEQGLREGLLAGIEIGLQLRFGAEGLRLFPEICKISDVHVLRAIQASLKTVGSLEELQRIYRA
ncbi:MAG: Rpn family recombination-promoting nuclease/putative transposase [Acidobacteriota bacterium]